MGKIKLVVRAALAMPFYVAAVFCVGAANLIGGTTFVVRPRSKLLPNVTGYAGSMDDDGK